MAKCLFCLGSEVKQFGRNDQLEISVDAVQQHDSKSSFVTASSVVGKGKEEMQAFWYLDFKYCPYCGREL